MIRYTDFIFVFTRNTLEQRQPCTTRPSFLWKIENGRVREVRSRPFPRDSASVVMAPSRVMAAGARRAKSSKRDRPIIGPHAPAPYGPCDHFSY
ncbi:hypothetical protein EVAR_90545_1 [Eumeta japonica]|uniref:Uncharacterized protein n=1 Tax=Eumeta variegata TaxID=151549 RepID=A0A4C1XZV1_EUMVA|nr:hypothetical protein EVAR_90545_1 [Eumeta japonica]